MKSSASIAALAAALAKAQGEFPTIAFDAENPHFKSKFASLANIVATVRPILAKHGLAVVQGSINGETNEGVLMGMGVETIIVHSSGEWLSEVVYMPVEKPTAQGAGSALTYGRRYGFCSALNLVSDADDDGETASNHPQTPRPASTRPATASTPPKASSGQAAPNRTATVPFGDKKGTLLSDLTQNELDKLDQWCKKDDERAEKFKDLIASIRAENAARTVRPGLPVPEGGHPDDDEEGSLPF